MNIFRNTFLAATLLLSPTFVSAQISAQPSIINNNSIVGLWYFNVTIDGLPSSQCIQVGMFHADGTMEGPANDHLSGDQRGTWTARGSDGEFRFTILQNNINADGTAGGLYVIKNTMTMSGTDSGTGKFTFQILNNAGAVVFAGTGSFKATRVRP